MVLQETPQARASYLLDSQKLFRAEVIAVVLQDSLQAGATLHKHRLSSWELVESKITVSLPHAVARTTIQKSLLASQELLRVKVVAVVLLRVVCQNHLQSLKGHVPPLSNQRSSPMAPRRLPHRQQPRMALIPLYKITQGNRQPLGGGGGGGEGEGGGGEGGEGEGEEGVLMASEVAPVAARDTLDRALPPGIS